MAVEQLAPPPALTGAVPSGLPPARSAALWRQTARRLTIWLAEIAVVITLVAILVGDVR